MLFFDIFHLDSLGLFVPLHRKECLLWKKKWLTGWRLCLPKSKKVVSSKWLAEQLGKDRGTVSKWVTNTMQPDARNLLRIAEALNIDAGRLLNQKHLKNEWNKQIKSSEVSKMQFKERLLDSYDIGCELVAFSNARGGTLVVGVKDKTGSLNPLSYLEVQETTNTLSNIASENVVPAILVDVETISVDGGSLCCSSY